MRVRHLPGPADPLLPAVPRSRPRPGPGCPAPAAAWPAVQHPAQDRSGLVDGCLAEPGPARPSGLADSAQHHTFNPSGREGSSCLPPWSRAPCCSPGRGQGTSGSGSHFCCRRTRRPASGRRSWRRRLGMRSAGHGLRVPRSRPGPVRAHGTLDGVESEADGTCSAEGDQALPSCDPGVPGAGNRLDGVVCDADSGPVTARHFGSRQADLVAVSLLVAVVLGIRSSRHQRGLRATTVPPDLRGGRWAAVAGL